MNTEGTQSNDNFPYKCHSCGTRGHLARDCFAKKRTSCSQCMSQKQKRTSSQPEDETENTSKQQSSKPGSNYELSVIAETAERQKAPFIPFHCLCCMTKATSNDASTQTDGSSQWTVQKISERRGECWEIRGGNLERMSLCWRMWCVEEILF